jgi:hypothetical protein
MSSIPSFHHMCSLYAFVRAMALSFLLPLYSKWGKIRGKGP